MVSRDVASLAQKIEGETKSVVDKIEDTKRWVVEHVENLFSKKFIWLVGSLIGGVGVLYAILRLLENARPWRLDLGRDRCCRRDPYSCDLDVAVSKNADESPSSRDRRRTRRPSSLDPPAFAQELRRGRRQSFQRRTVSESIEQLATDIGGDLQKLEHLLKTSGDKRTKIRFPRGFLRTAAQFRERFLVYSRRKLAAEYRLFANSLGRLPLAPESDGPLGNSARNAYQRMYLLNGISDRKHHERCDAGLLPGENRALQSGPPK